MADNDSSGQTTEGGSQAGTSSTGPETKGTGTTPPAATFTQDDVNRMVADRLSRERSKFSDYDDLKAKAAQLDQLQEANASDLEKATKAARAEGAKEVTDRFLGIIRSQEVRAQAAALRFRNPQLAVAALRERGTLDTIKVNDDGTVDTAAVERELKALAEAESYLIVTEEKKPASPAEAGVGAGSSTGKGEKRDTPPGIPTLAAAYAGLAGSKK